MINERLVCFLIFLQKNKTVAADFAPIKCKEAEYMQTDVIISALIRLVYGEDYALFKIPDDINRRLIIFIDNLTKKSGDGTWIPKK